MMRTVEIPAAYLAALLDWCENSAWITHRKPREQFVTIHDSAFFSTAFEETKTIYSLFIDQLRRTR